MLKEIRNPTLTNTTTETYIVLNFGSSNIN